MVRLKHRYLLVKILYPDQSTPEKDRTGHDAPGFLQFNHTTSDTLTPQLLMRLIKDSASNIFGDYGIGLLSGGLSVKYLSPATSTMILRCPRSAFRLLWASLTFITHLPPNETPCVFRVVRVSGTIRKAEEEAITRARAELLRAKAIRGSDADPLDALLGQTGDKVPVANSHPRKHSIGNDESGFESDEFSGFDDSD